MNNFSNARREAQSRTEVQEYLRKNENEFGAYELIFDRGTKYAPVSRYLKREEVLSMPSPAWTEAFVRAGGSFDSCGSWGIYPSDHYEKLEISPEFAGEILALLGRADYDYTSLPDVFASGIRPKTRAEFHACVRGIERKHLAEKAGCPTKSLMRLGWMTEPEWTRFICRTSTRVVEGTSHNSFNGVWGEFFQTLLSDEQCLKNPVFAGWVEKRPSGAEMSRRQLSHTSVGQLKQTKGGDLLRLEDEKKFKSHKARKLTNQISVAKVAEMWFVWNPEVGFQRHMENASLREALQLWENRSKQGEPRPLSLNDVRNDHSGTAGFCLAGTKGFLQNRMPFVYRLISRYSSWEEIPAEIMSTQWEVDFKIFQGYPIP